MMEERSDVRDFEASAVREHSNARTPEHSNALLTEPKVLALDFDGVLCDTLHEVLRSTWHVYREIWDACGDGPPSGAGAAFARVRSVLEIGWEAPVLLRAIVEGVPEAALLREFQTKWRSRILQEHHLVQADLSARFDAARDAWIRANLEGWLGCQHLYPGVVERLQGLLQSDVQIVVITTKESRFAHLIMERNGVPFPIDCIWGKDRDRPKVDLLRILRQERGVNFADIWFVEDRFKTLRSVQQHADLNAVGLFLATWGYSTPAERAEGATDPRICPLTLGQFCADFSAWTRPEEAGSHGGAT
jgi:phosphoglycolate phosphatase-like HAD superfamily hydrolase